MTKPLTDPTQQSASETAFWERTEREADAIAAQPFTMPLCEFSCRIAEVIQQVQSGRVFILTSNDVPVAVLTKPTIP